MGANIIYLMITPTFAAPDWITYQKNVADIYVQSIKTNAIKNVVILSSVGAHPGSGAGPEDGLSYLEKELGEINNLNVKNLRQGYFFTNLFQQIGMIKHVGIMGSAQPAEHKMVLAHYKDIADVAFEELNQLKFVGQSYRYVVRDERSWKEIIEILTAEVGKKGTPFIFFNDEQNRKGMQQANLPETIINGYVEIGKTMRDKIFDANYWSQRTELVGQIKLEDFTKEFAEACKNS